MSLSTVLAGYLPEAMIIRMSPALPVYDHSGNVLRFPTPPAFGCFFHEYAHFLHNISTISGISVFFNTVELWRCFRTTIGADGDSVGSGMFPTSTTQHLGTLLTYLRAVRRNNAPVIRLIQRPTSITIKSHEMRSVAVQANTEVLASIILCQAEIADNGGQTESVEVSIGMLELIESAAWLLEKSVVRALDSTVQAPPAPIFPNEVGAALGKLIAPSVDESALIASLLAALQSSDAPSAFPETMAIARDAAIRGKDPVSSLRGSVQSVLNQETSTLDNQFAALEREFNSDGIMAVAMRRIVAAARAAFEMRKADPFFELAMIAEISGGASVQQILRRIPSCALKQEETGPEDKPQRDLLISFLPVDPATGRDPEDGLRTMHAVFDYVFRHVAVDKFVPTAAARRRPCPFYTCCDLKLRVEEPNICRSEPWLSADWPRWGAQGKCWYGTAVSITRPPAVAPFTVL